MTDAAVAQGLSRQLSAPPAVLGVITCRVTVTAGSVRDGGHGGAVRGGVQAGAGGVGQDMADSYGNPVVNPGLHLPHQAGGGPQRQRHVLTLQP